LLNCFFCLGAYLTEKTETVGTVELGRASYAVLLAYRTMVGKLMERTHLKDLGIINVNVEGIGWEAWPG
jgi:hypothetical protein